MSKPLEKMDHRELAAELRQALGRTADMMARAADVWHEIKQRGWAAEFRREVSYEVAWQLERIKEGRLRPEVCIALAAEPDAIRAMYKMATKDQISFLKGQCRLTVLDGKTEVQKPITECTREQRQAAIAEDGRVRSVAEQRQWKRDQPQKEQRAIARHKPEPDTEAGGFWVGGKGCRFVPADWGFKAEAECAPTIPKRAADTCVPLLCPVPPEVREAVPKMAKEMGMSDGDFIVQCLAIACPVLFAKYVGKGWKTGLAA